MAVELDLKDGSSWAEVSRGSGECRNGQGQSASEESECGTGFRGVGGLLWDCGREAGLECHFPPEVPGTAAWRL